MSAPCIRPARARVHCAAGAPVAPWSCTCSCRRPWTHPPASGSCRAPQLCVPQTISCVGMKTPCDVWSASWSHHWGIYLQPWCLVAAICRCRQLEDQAADQPQGHVPRTWPIVGVACTNVCTADLQGSGGPARPRATPGHSSSAITRIRESGAAAGSSRHDSSGCCCTADMCGACLLQCMHR